MLRSGICAAIILVHSVALAQPACTPERIREINVELDGIAAMRRMGGLDFARGVCTVVRSTEDFIGRFGGDSLAAIDRLLKNMGVTVPPNIISGLCKTIHLYVDDFAVGKRERELREELATCTEGRKPE